MKLIFHPFSYTSIITSIYSPCCIQCPNDTLKYYYIDKKTNKCGETCLHEKWYNTYNFFKTGLIHDNHTSYPCVSYGYSIYDTKRSYGVWPIRIDVDLYNNLGYIIPNNEYD